MKVIPVIFLLAVILLGCNSSSVDYPQESSNVDSEPSSAEALTFSLDNLTITVNHKNMEVSEECPEVLLLDKQSTIIDKRSLCQVNIESYRSFDAREDFAFISFEDYRLDGGFLIYSIDLALLRGSAFIAVCRLPILENQLGAAKCKKQGS